MADEKRLTFYYTEEYIKELDKKKHEDAAVKEMQESGSKSGEIRCMVLTAEQNAKVMMDCMTDLIHAVRILTDMEQDIDDWMLAGISAMLDKIGEQKVIPYDLPVCINGTLGAQYR